MKSGTRKKRHVARSPEDLEKKKQVILDGAMRLLVEKGYTKTTMTDVAAEAGVGRGTVYWHFPSKEELFFSLMVRETEKIEAQLEGVLVMQGRAVERIESMMRAGIQAYEEVPQFFRAFLSFLSGTGEETQQRLVDLMSGIYGKYNRLVEDLLEQGKAEGDVRQDLDSPVAAAAYVVMLDAMFLQVEFGLVPRDPQRLGDALVGAIRRGYLDEAKGGTR